MKYSVEVKEFDIKSLINSNDVHYSITRNDEVFLTTKWRFIEIASLINHCIINTSDVFKLSIEDLMNKYEEFRNCIKLDFMQKDLILKSTDNCFPLWVLDTPVNFLWIDKYKLSKNDFIMIIKYQELSNCKTVIECLNEWKDNGFK